MTLPSQHWRVAPAEPSDLPFILDSWANDACIWESRQANEDPDIFKVGMRERIVGLVSRNNVIAIRPTEAYWAATGETPDPRKLFAFICYGIDRKTLRPIVHFVYVKAAARDAGIATTLLKLAGARPDKACWSTCQRPKLLKAMARRSIMTNRFLLDYDPGAKPAKGSWKYP